MELQSLLAEHGRHAGGVALPDLMIAATAERHGLVGLHYDADLDRIAAVSGQATDRVVERGSVP